MLRHATTFAVIAMGNISPIDMAQIESAYFYGYCIGTAPMGFVGDKLGARLLIALAVGGSGALSCSGLLNTVTLELDHTIFQSTVLKC